MTAPTPRDESSASRRGDICPPWCGGEHLEDRTYGDRPMHPDDQGMLHRRTLEKWHPRYGADGALYDEAIVVWIEEKRYDNDPEGDWLEVYADNVHPGFMADVGLKIADARRLGEALIRACDIVEGRQ